VTDETNASRIMLFDIHARRWDHELLKILNVPHSMLPEVNSSSDVYGQRMNDRCFHKFLLIIYICYQAMILDGETLERWKPVCRIPKSCIVSAAT
jgi:glycerol kinase